jgi:hypothetical protein
VPSPYQHWKHTRTLAEGEVKKVGATLGVVDAKCFYAFSYILDDRLVGRRVRIVEDISDTMPPSKTEAAPEPGDEPSDRLRIQRLVESVAHERARASRAEAERDALRRACEAAEDFLSHAVDMGSWHRTVTAVLQGVLSSPPAAQPGTTAEPPSDAGGKEGGG